MCGSKEKHSLPTLFVITPIQETLPHAKCHVSRKHKWIHCWKCYLTDCTVEYSQRLASIPIGDPGWEMSTLSSWLLSPIHTLTIVVDHIQAVKSLLEMLFKMRARSPNQHESLCVVDGMLLKSAGRWRTCFHTVWLNVARCTAYPS